MTRSRIIGRAGTRPRSHRRTVTWKSRGTSAAACGPGCRDGRIVVTRRIERHDGAVGVGIVFLRRNCQGNGLAATLITTACVSDCSSSESLAVIVTLVVAPCRNPGTHRPSVSTRCRRSQTRVSVVEN